MSTTSRRAPAKRPASAKGSAVANRSATARPKGRPAPPPPAEPEPVALPRTVLCAAAAVAVLALVLGGFGIYFVIEGFTGTPRNRSAAESTAVMAIIVALCLALVVRGLLRLRRWSRAPAALTFVFCLPVAAYGGLIQAGRYAIGIPVLAVAVAGLFLLFAPASNRVLSDAPTDQG